MDIIKIIDKYGPEISKQLQIATTQVHEKVVWYVQVSGVLGLIQTILWTIFLITCGAVSFKIIKKRYDKSKNKYDRASEVAWEMFCACMIILVLSGIIGLLGASLFDNIAKIWFPDYYIIQQILAKAGI